MGKRVAVAVLLLAVIGVAACGDDKPAPPAVKSAPPAVQPSTQDTKDAPPAVQPDTHDTKAAPPAVEVPPWAKVAPEQIAEAKKYGVPVAFENDLGMRFVLIPAGTFVMGSAQQHEAWKGGETAVTHQFARPFYMQVTEVTNLQFKRYESKHDSGEYHSLSLAADTQPAGTITWLAARAFANWLSQRDEDRVYRLPTEVEWEYACRARTSTTYWWGDSAEEGWKYANALDPLTKEVLGFRQDGWSHDDGQRVSAPVATYPPNPWGLHDMLGNAEEWCANLFWRDPTDSATLVRGPIEGGSRTLRGGSWRSTPERLRATGRAGNAPDFAGTPYGFRLVSPLPEPPGATR